MEKKGLRKSGYPFPILLVLKKETIVGTPLIRGRFRRDAVEDVHLKFARRMEVLFSVKLTKSNTN